MFHLRTIDTQRFSEGNGKGRAREEQVCYHLLVAFKEPSIVLSIPLLFFFDTTTCATRRSLPHTHTHTHTHTHAPPPLSLSLIRPALRRRGACLGCAGLWVWQPASLFSLNLPPDGDSRAALSHKHCPTRALSPDGSVALVARCRRAQRRETSADVDIPRYALAVCQGIPRTALDSFTIFRLALFATFPSTSSHQRRARYCFKGGADAAAERVRRGHTEGVEKGLHLSSPCVG